MVYSQAYAAIEDFVSRRLSVALSILSKSLPPSQYPVKLTRTFRENCATVLRDIEKVRYAAFDPKEIVSNLGDVLSDTKREMNSQIALMSFENHRLSEIARLFELCGIEGLKGRIESDERFAEFFLTAAAEDNTVDGYLSRIVRERNAAAHTLVETITSAALQLETIAFAEVLVRCLDDYVLHRELQIMQQVGSLVRVGVVSETFRSGRIAIVKVQGEIAVHERLLLSRGHQDFLIPITSLQLDGVDQASVRCRDETEVGVMGCKFQLGDEIFRPAS